MNNKFKPTSFKEFFDKSIKDPEIKAEYDRLGPEYEIIDALIKKRIAKKISQKDLAIKMGTKQSALSRLESGTYNPSLLFLKKVAAALDCQLHITLK